MAIDLCNEYKVCSVDERKKILQHFSATHPILTKTADLSNAHAIEPIIEDADLVIGAVPGFMDLKWWKTVINSGKNIVDISF